MGFEFGFIKELFNWDQYKISHSLVITIIIIIVIIAICIFVFGFSNNSVVNWIKGIIMIFAATFSLVIWHDHQIKKEIEEVHRSDELKEVSKTEDDQSKFIQPNFDPAGMQPIQVIPSTQNNISQNYNDMVNAQMLNASSYNINGGNQHNSEINKLYNIPHMSGSESSDSDKLLREIHESLNRIRTQPDHNSSPQSYQQV